MVSAPYMQPILGRFASLFAEHNVEVLTQPVLERLEEEDLLPIVKDLDGVICGDDRFTEKVIDAASKLKVISKWGTGIDSIDVAACHKCGIAVCNTAAAFTEPVADSVLGYVLCFIRNILSQNRLMHDGIWEKLPGISLQECTLGIIGVGNVGKAVARRAVAFGATVLANDIVDIPDDFLRLTGITMASKEELLQRSDLISLNCDLNPTSFHLIGTAEFSLMKKTAIIINTSRGPVIDEAALIQALEAKRIGGAALDVFEVEPLPPDNPLRKMDNVILAPHVANGSPMAWEKVHLNTLKNLFEVLDRNA